MKGITIKEVPIPGTVEMTISNENFCAQSKMLAIGTEVEIIDGYCGTDGYYYTCKIHDGIQMNIKSDDLEVTDFTPYIDWENRRYELAKAAMQGMLSNPECLESYNVIEYEGDYTKKVAHSAIHYADALIKELKGEKI